MRIQQIPIDFDGAFPNIKPRDQRLFDMALEYTRKELAVPLEPLDFLRFAKVWVCCVMRHGVPSEIVGITGWLNKPDIPLFRASGPNAARATKMMTDRYHDFFGDQGLRGCEVFIHISGKEAPEQRCHRWEESLKATGATPADRFSITVR